MATAPKIAVPESSSHRKKWTLIIAGATAVFVVFGTVLMQHAHPNIVAPKPDAQIVQHRFTVPGDSLNESDSLARIQEQTITHLEAEIQSIQAKQAETDQRLASASTAGSGGPNGSAPGQNEFQVNALAPFPPSRSAMPAPAPLPVSQPLPKVPEAASPEHHESMMLSATAAAKGGADSGEVAASGSVGGKTSGGAAAPKVKNVTVAYLPPGTYVTAVMLGGVDAPTGGQAQQNPHPVLLKAMAVAHLPNNHTIDIKGCVMIGAAYGSLSAERAYIRLETISCTLPGGQIAQANVKGFIDGPDGKTGILGKLVTKQGQMLARAFIAGLGSGIGGAYQMQAYNGGLMSGMGTIGTNGAVQPLIQPSLAFQYGIAGGVGTAFNQLAAYYLKMAEQTFALVEVPAGVEVQAVFNAPLRLQAEFNKADDVPSGLGVSKTIVADDSPITLQ